MQVSTSTSNRLPHFHHPLITSPFLTLHTGPYFLTSLISGSINSVSSSTTSLPPSSYHNHSHKHHFSGSYTFWTMLLPTPARNLTTLAYATTHPEKLRKRSRTDRCGTTALTFPSAFRLTQSFPNSCAPPPKHPIPTSSYYNSIPNTKPSPAASAFTEYKSEEKLRFIISFCAYNYLFHTHLPSPCLASTTSSTFPNSNSSGL